MTLLEQLRLKRREKVRRRYPWRKHATGDRNTGGLMAVGCGYAVQSVDDRHVSGVHSIHVGKMDGANDSSVDAVCVHIR